MFLSVIEQNKDSVSLLTNLVSVWEMNETSGTTVTDSHGANNGTTTGTVNQTGILDKAYLFNGTNQSLINNSTTIKPSTGAMSWSFWINPSSLTSIPDFISDRALGAFGTAEGYTIGHNGDSQGTIHFAIEGASGNSFDVRKTSAFTAAEGWIHFVVTWNGATKACSIYKNGVSLSLTNFSNSWVGGVDDCSNANTVLLGGRVSTTLRRLNGLYDQTAIWNKVLSSSEVLTLYNSGSGLDYSSWT